MKTRPLSALIRTTHVSVIRITLGLALLSAVETNLFAYWPPLQNVVTSVSGKTVSYAVFDASRNSWQSNSETFGADDYISSLVVSEGVVAFYVSHYLPLIFRYDGSEVHYAVYDPGLGNWRTGSKSHSGQDTQIFGLTVKDGVVAYTALYPAYAYPDLHVTPFGTYEIDYAVYNPESGSWDATSESASSPFDFISTPNVKEGLVAYWMAERNSQLQGTGNVYVNCAIYDPTSGGWKKRSDWYNNQPAVSSFTITNATVYYTLNSTTAFTNGYDPNRINNNLIGWANYPTKPKALYHASNPVGSPPRTVWFSDMSIGYYDPMTNSIIPFCWTFGDQEFVEVGPDASGVSRSYQRSTSHTYSSLGAYDVDHYLAVPNSISRKRSVINLGLVPPIVTWGDEYFLLNGQTGLFIATSPAPPGLSNIVAIVSENHRGLALCSNGTVIAWGDNTYGQRNVPIGLSNAVAISANFLHNLVLRGDGSVLAWGFNGNGQTNVPANLSDAVAIAAGSFHSLALKADGKVIGWGNNSYGQTSVPANLSNVVAIAAGDYHNLALRVDGTVVGWGRNDLGQITIPSGLSNIVAIATASSTCMALRSNGTVLAWGENRFGQATVPNALSNVVAISTGFSWSRALLADGTVFGWGTNGSGGEVPGNLSGVAAIYGGENYSAALVGITRPIIFQQPVGRVTDVGSNFLFVVQSTGLPTLSYQWRANGTNLVNGGRVNGANAPALVLTGVQTNDTADYTVVVTNSFGSVTSSVATLIVNTSPVITNQPQSLAVFLGDNASFIVGAIGTAPLSYQWRFNSTSIPGATNASYTLGNAQFTNAGDYSVIVSNVAGQITSATATLTVNYSPTSGLVTLAAWDVSGITSFGVSPLPPTISASNLTVVGLTRGPGVTTSGSPAVRAWGGGGFNSADALTAISAQDFVTFSLAANPGYTLSFVSISRFDYRRASAGPATGVLQYEIGNGPFLDITNLSYSSTSSSGGSLAIIDLSGISNLQHIPETNVVTFRIVNYGATSATGNWYIFDTASSSTVDFSIDGRVQIQTSNPAIAPTFTNVTLAGNEFRFTLSGTTGSTYVVQASTNLSTSNWISLQTNIAPFTFVESNLFSLPQRFYRGISAP